jgi:hypothetical protein
MADLRKARSPFASACDLAWRRERMFRYVYWLSKREHPLFNVVGSWRDEDIVQEIQLWKDIGRRQIDNDQIVEEITHGLESRFAMSLAAAEAAATDSGLAEAGLPIWNSTIGCLLPQTLGSLQIVFTTDYENTTLGQGHSYSYRPHEPESRGHRADLYIYTSGQDSLGSGVNDARVVLEEDRAWQGVLAALPGWTIPPERQIGPGIEICSDPYDREFALIGVAALMVKNDADVEIWTSLSLTALNDAFLKIRYTVQRSGSNAARINDELKHFNSDIASFCCHFAPKFGDDE